MQFKHLLYWTAVFSAACQILLAMYSRYYGAIAEQIQSATPAPVESEIAVVQALNYGLPVSVFCLALLLYTWKINKVGYFAIGVALAMQTIAVDLSLRAARHVFGEEASLASIAWWAPKDKKASAPVQSYPVEWQRP